MIGVIIGKLEINRKERNRGKNLIIKGYLAMIVVKNEYRRHKIG